MKIQLDTRKKTIEINEDVNLNDFYEEINTLLKNGEWKEYTLIIGGNKNSGGNIYLPPHLTQPYKSPDTTNPYPYPGTQITY